MVKLKKRRKNKSTEEYFQLNKVQANKMLSELILRRFDTIETEIAYIKLQIVDLKSQDSFLAESLHAEMTRGLENLDEKLKAFKIVMIKD